MANWDVIVIGLGGVGSAAVCHLARAGHRVLGLDRFSPVHDRGSSHGKMRIIRQAYFEHPSYVPMLRRAYQLWDELEVASGRQLLCRTGLVEMGPADGIVIPGVLQSAADYGLQIERLSAAEVTGRWPGLAGDPSWQAVVERNAGFLRVEDCVAAHLAVAHNSGATCVHGVTVTKWHASGNGVTVQTDQGTEHAASLVIAGGAWSTTLLDQLAVPLRVLRKHQYWFRPSGTELKCTVADGFPCFFHETGNGFFYGFPMVDQDGIKVARHSGGQEIDGPTPDHPADPEDRRLIDQYVSSYVPAASDNLVRRVGCYYTVTPDEHFVIDRHPDYRSVAVIAGLSGHGFKFTSVLGEIAARLASGADPEFELELFRIDRAAFA